MEYMQKAKAGGIGGMMKMMQDTEMLAKIGAKMGDMSALMAGGTGAMVGQAAPPPAAAAPQPQVEINDLLDAAKCAPRLLARDLVARAIFYLMSFSPFLCTVLTLSCGLYGLWVLLGETFSSIEVDERSSLPRDWVMLA